MALSVRPATFEDLFSVQRCNLLCLPENYQAHFYFYHEISWPGCMFVAEGSDKQVSGYVMPKIDNEYSQNGSKPMGHVTSVAIMRSHRQAGLASSLMKAAHQAMEKTYGGIGSSLNVRVSNRAAFSLYCDVLKYQVSKIETSYYADAEDAFQMTLTWA